MVKDNNVVIYIVGVGSGVDVDELIFVFSNFDFRYFMFVDNYQILNSLFDMFVIKICNGEQRRIWIVFFVLFKMVLDELYVKILKFF